MVWTQAMRKGAFGTALATIFVTAISLVYLKLFHGQGINPWAFTKMAFIIAAVWAAIGATMGIFIVMIISKNEGR